MKARLLGLSLLAGFWAHPSVAETAAQMFARLDINQDGVLSGTEATGYMEGDLNRDSMLSQEEFESGMDHADFKKADLNQDGWLSGIEKKGVEGYDVDVDGIIKKEEFLSSRAVSRGLIKQAPKAAAGVLEIGPKIHKVDSGLAVAEADGQPVALAPVKIPQDTAAATLTVGPDGTFHVLLMRKSGNAGTLLYTSSADAVQWSGHAVMPVPAGQTVLPSNFKLVFDGAGNALVFFTTAAPHDRSRMGIYQPSHSLYVCRVENGRWTDPAQIGETGWVHGYAPVVDGNGAVGVVWCEYYPVASTDGTSVLPQSGSSLVRWVSLSGSTPGQPSNLIEPNVRLINSGYGVAPDSYERPSACYSGGYLNLVLDKVHSVSGTEADCGVVLWSKPSPLLLLPLKPPGGNLARWQFAPGLFPGPSGSLTFVASTENQGIFSLAAYTIQNGQIVGQPLTLFTAQSNRGAMPYGGTASFASFPGEEALVGLPFGNEGSGYSEPMDAFLFHGGRGQWSPAVDVTNSSLRRGLIRASKVSSYNLPNPRAVLVSVAFGPRGERYALIVYHQNTWSVNTGLGEPLTDYESAAAMTIVRWTP